MINKIKIMNYQVVNQLDETQISLPEMIPFYQICGFTDVVKLKLMYRYQ